jgi:hypothetical protein
MDMIEEALMRKKMEAFYKNWASHKASGLPATQAAADHLAAQLGVTAPRVTAEPQRSASAPQAHIPQIKIDATGDLGPNLPIATAKAMVGLYFKVEVLTSVAPDESSKIAAAIESTNAWAAEAFGDLGMRVALAH